LQTLGSGAYLISKSRVEMILTFLDDTPPAQHPIRARLVSLPDGKAYPVGTTPVTIGRGPASEIAVHHEAVSRSHAKLLRSPEGFLLVDSSLHGTYVNGERVQGQQLLADRDLVRVGRQSFRFEHVRVPPA
jgi:pSer/pThr/pTyr-binding forkhead associated (FHA) protein